MSGWSSDLCSADLVAALREIDRAWRERSLRRERRCKKGEARAAKREKAGRGGVRHALVLAGQFGPPQAPIAQRLPTPPPFANRRATLPAALRPRQTSEHIPWPPNIVS